MCTDGNPCPQDSDNEIDGLINSLFVGIVTKHYQQKVRALLEQAGGTGTEQQLAESFVAALAALLASRPAEIEAEVLGVLQGKVAKGRVRLAEIAAEAAAKAAPADQPAATS